MSENRKKKNIKRERSRDKERAKEKSDKVNEKLSEDKKNIKLSEIIEGKDKDIKEKEKEEENQKEDQKVEKKDDKKDEQKDQKEDKKEEKKEDKKLQKEVNAHMTLKRPKIELGSHNQNSNVINNNDNNNNNITKSSDMVNNNIINNNTINNNIIELSPSEKTLKNTFYNESVQINKTSLIDYLKCPLCKGFYRKPFTINECMHTCCKSCICKWYNESNQRETCPVCDTKIGGRPMDSLIFDNNLASLIDILFPEFEELDKKNSKLLFETFRKEHDPLPGDEDEAKLQKPNLKIYVAPEGSFNKENKYKATLLVPKNLNIDTLKVIISQKNNLINKDLINVKYKNRELPADYTMDVIDTQYGFEQDKIIFYYTIKKKIG